jgi:hypothetical protein
MDPTIKDFEAAIAFIRLARIKIMLRRLARQ